jgi:hypothetical protein
MHQLGIAAVVGLVPIVGSQVSTTTAIVGLLTIAGKQASTAALAAWSTVEGNPGLDMHQLGAAAVMGLLTIAGSQVSTTTAVVGLLPIVGKQVSTAAVGPIVGKQDLDEG